MLYSANFVQLCHIAVNMNSHLDFLMLDFCSYLFNLIGQFISSHALQDQCCGIISALLWTFKSNPSEEMISVLGEQLQVYVIY